MKPQTPKTALSWGVTLLQAAAAFSFLTATTAVRADPWSEAQALFDARGEGRGKIAEARTSYRNLLATAVTPAEKVQAVSQLGRLAVYEGEMLLPKTDLEGRKAIFSECFCASPKVSYDPLPRPSCESPGFVDAISPAKLGDSHPAYRYFRSVCTAYWGEVAGPLEKLAYVTWLKEDFAAGQTLDTRFEGGGILRIAAGVYVNPKAAAVQLYNPEQALALGIQGINSAAYPGDPSGGAQYYENHAVVADAYKQLAIDRPNQGFKEKGIAHVTSALKEMDERIELDDTPAGRAPEFAHYYNRIKESYKTFTGLDWPQS